MSLLNQVRACWMASCVIVATLVAPASAQFQRQALSTVYFSEGANAGDLNRDGKLDVVCGPYWYAGPTFDTAHEIYPPQPQPVDFYADNFFSWVYDFNRDGWNDVFVVGFPGTPAYVYENPQDKAGHWPKHEVMDGVSNESPQLLQLTGDEQPELIFTRGGRFGFATWTQDGGFGPWTFHAISDEAAPERFGHGLGAGDLNGDQRPDLITAAGWFEQPAEAAETARWPFHPEKFTSSYGGAEMYAYDVDGDGDNDVITSLAAHDFGLAWYEQDRSGVEPVFRQHIIMGRTPDQNHYGVLFTELHSVALADMNGDGLQDIVTGKTYWSHHKQSPMWDSGAVVYWFELVRTPQGVDWIPHLIDDEAGIGRQLTVADLNGDRKLDIVVGGMKGAHVLRHPDKDSVPQVQARAGWVFPLQRRSTEWANEKREQVADAMEAEAAQGIAVTAGSLDVQEMAGFNRDRWSGGRQLFWVGGQTGSQMSIPVEVSEAGDYEITVAFTMAPDYAVVRTLLDGEELRTGLDLYNAPDVLSTGPLELGRRKLAAGSHTLTVEITGANPTADPRMMVGVDYWKLTKLP